MVQISYWANLSHLANQQSLTINNGSVTFFPMNFYESISLATVNVGIQHAANNSTVTLQLGLYSLNVSTLSLANFISGTTNETNGNNYWASITATSSAQNITPGTWWWGLRMSVANGTLRLFGNTVSANNSFPSAFVGGAMTASTSALPSSVATSNLDVTADNNEFNIPQIILSA